MESKVAVIAGASRGAGKGIALVLAEAGYTVYILGRTRAQSPMAHLGSIDRTAQEIIDQGGTAKAHEIDCTDFRQLQKFFDLIHAQLGRLDILVNSAWGGHDKDLFSKSILENPIEPWEYMMNRGTRNYYITSCTAAPLLKATPGSLLINVSFWDNDKYTGAMMYDLSKNAMNRLALGFHHELAGSTVTCISLSPGYMKTERVLHALEQNPELAEHFGVPTESTHYIGRAVAALASDPARYQYSGKTLRVSDLARQYDFTDLDGTQPEPFRIP